MRRIAKPFFPWVGGKLFLLPYIFQLLPRRAPRLLEVCGGSGAVTLGLGAGYAPLRVYNDIDADLANLFRCARDRPLALLRELDFLPLHARADFEVVLRFLNHGYDPNDFLEEELQIRGGVLPAHGQAGGEEAPDGPGQPAGRTAGCGLLSEHPVQLQRHREQLRRAQRGAAPLPWPAPTRLGRTPGRGGGEQGLLRCGSAVRPDGCGDLCGPALSGGGEDVRASFALRDHVRLHDCLCAPAARDSHIVLSYNSHPDILDLFAPDFYIVGFDRPNPMARQEDSRYHELLMTNFDPSPMLNRQLSLLDNPGLVSSDRPELRILSAPTGRLPRVWDWPQD